MLKFSKFHLKNKIINFDKLNLLVMKVLNLFFFIQLRFKNFYIIQCKN